MSTDLAKNLKFGFVNYWLRGQQVQNFGDFLGEYAAAKLFDRIPVPWSLIYLCGSVIFDSYIRFIVDGINSKEIPSQTRVLYWGCGCRDEKGISSELRPYVDFLSVRGPLTREALALDENTALGDPGLLLPLVYQPNLRTSTKYTLCIPHFSDTRTDAELLLKACCSKIVRTSIKNTFEDFENLIDSICNASFVLTASLHGAIIAAAYGIPFCYWENGNFDVIFKWDDFARSINIPCIFERDLEKGRLAYENKILPVLKIPSLSKILSAAPFPVKPDVLFRSVKFDSKSYSLESQNSRGRI